MTFLHPEFLYFMLPPVIILFAFLLTQQEEIADFFAPEVIEKLRVRNNRMSLKVRNLLFFIMSLLLVIALAQPVIEEGTVKVEAKSADIMIALDISDSMLAEDVYPSRLEHAKQKILELLALSPQERIGVMAFAKASYLVAPLSFDHRAITYLVTQLQPGYLTEKGTDLSQLLKTAAEMMKAREEKYLLILSDGGDAATFEEEIALANRLGITVFVLGTGTEKGAPIRLKEGGFVKENGAIIISRLNPAAAELATKTGGSYIGSVAGNEDVQAMLAEIAAKTTKRTLAEEEIMQYEQLFYYPLGLAMLLLLVATSSMSSRRRVELPVALVCGTLLFSTVPSQAGLLDFELLKEAKSAYEEGDFNTSAALYGAYAEHSKSPEALYDHASALYKKGDYANAAALFEKAVFDEDTREFDRLHNLGNALAKSGSGESLQKAVTAYEQALALKEEIPTRENLETVKKLLEEQQQKPPSNDSQEQQDKEQDARNDGQKKDQQPDKGSKDEEPQQHKSDQESTPGDTKSEQSPEKSEQQQEGMQQQGKEQADQQERDNERHQQKSAKSEEEKAAEEMPSGAAEPAAEGMSELEEKKWLKMLSDQPASHIYRISPMNDEREESNAKPW